LRPDLAQREVLALEPLAPVAHANSMLIGLVLVRSPTHQWERLGTLILLCVVTIIAHTLADARANIGVHPTLPFGLVGCVSLWAGAGIGSIGQAVAERVNWRKAREAALHHQAGLAEREYEAVGISGESCRSHSSVNSNSLDLFGDILPSFPRPGTPSSISSLDDAAAESNLESAIADAEDSQIVYRVDAVAGAPMAAALARPTAGRPRSFS